MSKDTLATVGSEGWKSWQIALAVGVPVTIAGIYAFKKYSNRGKAALGTPASDNKVQNDVSAQAYKKKGNKHFMAGLYKEAIECYSKAIELGSEVNVEELSTFHQNRAAAHEHMKNYLQVIADCSKALELNPKYIKALNRRAKAYKSTGFLTECLHDTTAACILESFSNQNNVTFADEIIKELSQKKAAEKIKTRPIFNPSPVFVWTVLNSFSQDPIFRNGESSLEEHSIEAEGKENSPFYIAMKEFYAGNFKNVIGHCDEELNKEDSKQRLDALLLRGTFYLLVGKFDLANEDFDAILESDAVNSKHKVNVLIKKAKINLQKSDAQGAIELFKKAEEVDQNNPDIYMHRGQMHLVMDASEMAIADFQKSISLYDNLPTPQIHKCLAEVKKMADSSDPQVKDFATKSFENLAAKFPNCSDVFAFYGQALMDLKMWEEAEKCFDKAIEMDPKNPTSYVHKGILQISKNANYEDAMNNLKKAIKLDEKNSFALQALGSIELQNCALDRAMELIKQAIEVSSHEMEMAHLYSLLLSAEIQVKLMELSGPLASSPL